MLSFQGMPRMAVIAILILALIGAVWFWKRWTSSSVDKETENVKAARNAAIYADTIAQRAEFEQSPAVTGEYTAEVARGLQGDMEVDHAVENEHDANDDELDLTDEEYEPME